MKSKLSFYTSIFFLTLFFLSFSKTHEIEFMKEESLSHQNKLDNILEGTFDYCEKIKSVALFFVCRERIEEIIYKLEEYSEFIEFINFRRDSLNFPPPPHKFKKHTYVYDYQLIKKKNQIEESRILLEKNGKKTFVKNAPLKTKRVYSKSSVFGPVTLFSRENKKNFTYKLINEGRLEGRDVYIINAIPREREGKKINFGKVWVDKEDFSILKIEVDEESIGGFGNLKTQIKKYRLIPMIKDVHIYGIKKNGIRFPSKTIIEEIYRTQSTKLKKSLTTVHYSDYQFFVVEVDVKY